MRFWKRKKVGPAVINLTLRGISVSISCKLFRVTRRLFTLDGVSRSSNATASMFYKTAAQLDREHRAKEWRITFGGKGTGLFWTKRY